MSTLKPANNGGGSGSGGETTDKKSVKFDADSEMDSEAERAETEEDEEDGEYAVETWELQYDKARAYLDDCIALLVRSPTATAKHAADAARSARNHLVLMAEELRGDAAPAAAEEEEQEKS